MVGSQPDAHPLNNSDTLTYRSLTRSRDTLHEEKLNSSYTTFETKEPPSIAQEGGKISDHQLHPHNFSTATLHPHLSSTIPPRSLSTLSPFHPCVEDNNPPITTKNPIQTHYPSPSSLKKTYFLAYRSEIIIEGFFSFQEKIQPLQIFFTQLFPSNFFVAGEWERNGCEPIF